MRTASATETSLRGTSTLGVTLPVALGVVLGASLLRVAQPSIGWYLGDSVDLSTCQLLPYAVTPFLRSADGGCSQRGGPAGDLAGLSSVELPALVVDPDAVLTRPRG
jgi:hypothetical protein